jgi:hypothetical protein
MKTKASEQPSHVAQGNEESEGYDGLLASIRERFSAATASGVPLFITSLHGTQPSLFDLFLSKLPAERQQHYTCRTCRRFMDRFGDLVTIDANGDARSVIWNEATAPAFFKSAVAAMKNVVAGSAVTGVFLNDESTWGTPTTKASIDPATEQVKAPFEWHHMTVKANAKMVHKPTALLTTNQAKAEKLHDREGLCRALDELSIDTVRTAHTYLTTGSLYRSEKCVTVAKWLLDLHEALVGAKNKHASVRDHLTWRAAALAPAGFCHVKSTMIGTLLEDIDAKVNGVAKYSFAQIKARFDEKMSAANYQRATVAPSAGNIAAAEKIIATMQATGSLDRRYAKLEDLLFTWRSASHRLAGVAKAGAVFGHLTPKAPRATVATSLATDMPAMLMTWDKFQRVVLPDAVSIDALVPASSDRFVALVTAQSESPPLLQWDTEDDRNPVSWYYHAGIDAEIKRRVIGAGGMYEGCDIRASLAWNNRNDLDIHVIAPNGEEVFFNNKRARCGGWLDVDMNVRGETETPCENIRWAKGGAARGRYTVFVENYSFHERSFQATPFRVELEVNGEVFHFDGVTPSGATHGSSRITVAMFDYIPGHKLAATPPGLRAPQTNGRGWNVTPGTWAKITGIVASPNLWGATPLTQHGRHMFFLLEGCRDTTEGVGRGFFVETLRSEFHSIRSTLEAYAAGATIDGAEQATACGIGMKEEPNGKPWELILRVMKKDGSTVLYKLDRWD